MKPSPLTRFFCQELLYDFATDRLTPERKNDISEFLESDEGSREDLESLKAALAFCEELANIQPPVSWAERWQNLPPALAKRISDLETKIVSRFWAAIPFVVTAAVAVLGISIFKPWRAFTAKEIVIWTPPAPIAEHPSVPAVAEIEKTGLAAQNKTAEVAKSDPPNLPPKVIEAPISSPVETKPVPKVEIKVAPPAARVTKTSWSNKNSAAKSDFNTLAGNESANGSSATVAPAGPDPDLKAEEEMTGPVVASDSGNKSSPGQLRGEIYRAFLEVHDFEKTSNQIRDKILELKGEKARKVDLGWHRKVGESYFHFSLPETNIDELTQFLKAYGQLKISKEKHPLVMQAGKVRIILIVKSEP
jgi:hypothetical protein